MTARILRKFDQHSHIKRKPAVSIYIQIDRCLGFFMLETCMPFESNRQGALSHQF